MPKKFNLDKAVAGLFPGWVSVHSYPTFPDHKSVTIVIELGFNSEFDIEDRAEDAEELCRRVRIAWRKFCDASPQYPEMADMAVAVLLKFTVMDQYARDN